MNKQLKLMLTFILIISLCTVMTISSKAAGTYFLYEGLLYGVNDGKAYIHGSDGEGWDIVIREKFLNKYDVTEIEEYAFFENESIEQVSFEEALHLEIIGDGAFSRCTKLKEVYITPSIKVIGTGAFDGCTSLSHAYLWKDSVKNIPRQCFYGCTSLETIELMDEPESIGPLAFANCSSLKRIDILSKETEIADNAFEGCDELVIYCTNNSSAMQYAEDHDIDYVVIDSDPEMAYILGDADDNKNVSVADATWVQFKLAKYHLEVFNEVAADIDKNGLDVSDATLIQRHLAGFESNYAIGEIVNSSAISEVSVYYHE